jgi:hypothetical protein
VFDWTFYFSSQHVDANHHSSITHIFLLILSVLCDASSLLTCLPQLGSTDGVDCAVKTEVRECASDKPHSIYFRNVQNLDRVISYRHITILFVIFVVSSTKFFLFILI